MDWDWDFTFSVSQLKNRDDPYLDFRHLELHGPLLRPSRIKVEDVEMSFLPDPRLNEDAREHVCSVPTEAVGKKDAGKTIENRTQPKLVPNQASKSNIVRGSETSCIS
jgi:hypothetical protein